MKRNQTMRRGLGILLSLVMCLSLLPATALAADPEPATATADFTTNVEAALTLLGGQSKAEWNNATSTLTLKGVNFTTTAATAVKLPNGATIVLAAGTENTITGVCDDTVPDESYGIYVWVGGLTIEGSGQLTVTAGKSIENSYGIYVYSGELAIKGGTVTATGGESNQSNGIYAGPKSSMTISGKTTEVTAIGGSAKSDGTANPPFSVGLSGESIAISGGTVIATGGGPADDTTENGSVGIYTNNINSNLTVSGGTVIATGGTAKGTAKTNYSRGINVGGDVIIEGGTVTATGGKADYGSYGVFSGGATITGGTLTATGGKATGNDGGSYGVFSFSNTPTISGGHVTARTLADANAAPRKALNRGPKLSGSDYSWRINVEDSFTTGGGYFYSDDHTYVEFFFPKPISGCKVDRIPNQSYADGTPLTPAVTVRDGDVTLTEGTDYTVSYQDNVDVGPATVTITGKGDYGGTISKKFNIVPLDSETMTVDQEGCTYGEKLPNYVLSGKPNSISTTVLYTGTLAKDGSDYSSAKKPTEAGSYTVTVFCETPDTNFKATASFTIDPRSIKDFTVTLSDTELAYTGDSRSVTVRAVGDLAAGDYEASGTSGTNAGEYTVTVTGKGNYTGTATAPWRITKIDPPVPTGVTGIKGKTVSTARLPNGWWWNYPDAILDASGTFKARYTDKTGNYNNVSGVDVAVTLVEGYTVTAYGLYGTTMGIEPGETYTESFVARDEVGVQIGKRDGYKLKDVTLEGITEGDLIWAGKDSEEFVDRGFVFLMPENDVTVTVNWERIGGSGGGSTATYAIAVDSAKNGAVTASHKSAAKGTTVTLTVDPDKGYTLETITVTDKNGDEIELTNKGDGKYTFTMPASKVTVKATFMEDNAMLNFFVDVPVGAYYYDAVLWAAENGITGGVDDTHFAPDASCTRAQIVTFLWRAAGSPKVSGSNPFSDVSADAYYYDAVLWAVEKGITSGTSATTFAPDATVTRGQTVTFLYRAAGSPAASGSGFSDVSSDAYYADAVAWAVQQNITTGTGDGKFSPDADCTRAQIVTFLYRAMGE